jgi:hypothetical protein
VVGPLGRTRTGLRGYTDCIDSIHNMHSVIPCIMFLANHIDLQSETDGYGHQRELPFLFKSRCLCSARYNIAGTQLAFQYCPSILKRTTITCSAVLIPVCLASRNLHLSHTGGICLADSIPVGLLLGFWGLCKRRLLPCGNTHLKHILHCRIR